jgi:hypothetical protein
MDPGDIHSVPQLSSLLIPSKISITDIDIQRERNIFSHIMADQTGKMASDHVEDTVAPDLQKDKISMPHNMPSFLVGLSAEEREAVEKKLVRKVDIRLLIMMVVMYILNYLDRNNIAAAKLAGLEKSLNLTGDQYQVSLLICWQ